ncbi:hypothetical protein VTN00DRAFT_5880 [Thermoascus crustaceus]|uniref:uncharacterized protein n=1 Tax=Thermoascus crustaceus TaxID=5088 RepID=UPI003743A4DD
MQRSVPRGKSVSTRPSLGKEKKFSSRSKLEDRIRNCKLEETRNETEWEKVVLDAKHAQCEDVPKIAGVVRASQQKIDSKRRQNMRNEVDKRVSNPDM